MASPLADLDELVLKCRDDKAKKYIKEAVECYKSGALPAQFALERLLPTPISICYWRKMESKI